jgi:signal transduction histidine kinase
LTFKLSAILLLILSVAGAAQTLRLLSSFGGQWAQRQEEIGTAVLERALPPGTGERIGPGPLRSVLEEGRFGRIALRLYDRDGQLLDWIGSLDGQPEIGPAQLEVLRSLGPNQVRRLIRLYEGVALGLRVDSGGSGPHRFLVYSLSREPDAWVRAFNRMAQRNILFYTVIAGLAGLLLVRWLRRRLKALAAAFHRVAAGDLSTRVHEPREPELAELARSFNAMAAALEQAQEQRRQAEDERRGFMAQASHELRTPLTSLQGYLETLTMAHLDLPADTRRGYVDRAFLEAQELGHRVEDLVELVRLERPSFRLNPAEIELGDLLEELARRYGPLAASAGVELLGLDVAPRVRAVWDRRRMAQALGNLLHNAIKASPRGATVRLAVATVGEGRLRLEISDQGPGLAGYQDADGLGLGLKIARRLIERHGGCLGLHAAPVRGLQAVVEVNLFPEASPQGVES